MTYAYHIPQHQNNAHLEQAVSYLETTYTLLSEQTDLSPDNEIINRGLSSLVSQLTHWQESPLFSFEDLALETEELLIKLPVLCAQAEIEMEKWWARKIIEGKQTLEDFTYLDNYKALTKAEYELLKNTRCQNIIFLGSGSLPLTAMILSEQLPHLGFTCIDYDPEACDLAYNLIKQTHQESRIEVIEYPADDYTYHAQDMIICASLLNASNIYEKLYSSNVPEILTRDVESFFSYLYHPAKQPCKLKYRETAKTQLNSQYINTSRYFERISP